VLGVAKQIVASVTDGLLRSGDPAYADGDDARWTAVDWPSMTWSVDLPSGRVIYVDTGGEDLPALLFIHGLGGRWQNWLLNMPAFMDTHRVIAPDLPGFGASAMPAETITMRGYGRLVDELCDLLGVDCPAVVGHSMGGLVGAEVAVSFPTRVRRLVLVSAAGVSVEHRRREPLMTGARLLAAHSTRIAAYRESVVRRPRVRRLGLQSVVRYPERLSAALTWELVQGTGRPGFVPALDALLGYSLRARLGAIEVPALIVWGREDRIVPVSDAADYEAMIGANARTVIFDDTGHLPMVERPSRFNALLRAEISGEEPSAPRRRRPARDADAAGGRRPVG
jgi:pimeloyl-ACP methyl ester carboxylesterase